MSLRLPGYLTLSGITVAMPEPYNVVVPLNIALSDPKDNRANLEMAVRDGAAKVTNIVKFNQYMDSCGLTKLIPITINGNTYSGGIWGSSSSQSPTGVNPYGSVNISNWNSKSQWQKGNSNVRTGASGQLNESDYNNSSAIFSLRLSLIEEYCEKWGKSVDVEELKSKYASDPQKGVEVCDDILNNKFNQAKLKDIVNKKYNDYNKSRDDAGKAISDKWVDTVLKGKLGNIDISSGGVTKDNILDVIGTFMTNKDVKNGKVSLYNVFESPKMTQDMINVLKQRADETLQRKDVTDDDKARILSSIESLRANYDKYDESLDTKNPLEFNKVRGSLEKSYMDLFGTLRMHEAKHNDKVAPQYYGLPKDSKIKFNDQTQRAQEEISSYKNRRKLSTKI